MKVTSGDLSRKRLIINTLKKARGKLILVGLFAIPFLWVVLWHNVQFGSTPLPILGSVTESVTDDNPDIKFTDQSGTTTSIQEFKGQIYIASFISKDCKQECPVLLGHLKILTEKLTTSRDVQFHSYSLNPTSDTVKALSSLSENFEANYAQWKFFTGENQDLKALATQYFNVPEKDQIIDDSLDHSTTFYLIDKEGQIRATCDGLVINEVLVFVDAAHHLLKGYMDELTKKNELSNE